jgi:hypothetical protein
LVIWHMHDESGGVCRHTPPHSALFTRVVRFYKRGRYVRMSAAGSKQVILVILMRHLKLLNGMLY